MQGSFNIWLIDTSVFCNILNIPGRNQHIADIKLLYHERIKENHRFFLPWASVIETGNFISKLNGDLRRTYAEKYVQVIKDAINQEAPFTLISPIDKKDLLGHLNHFVDCATGRTSFADFTIISDFRELISKQPNWHIEIWSLDGHLQGFSHRPNRP